MLNPAIDNRANAELRLYDSRVEHRDAKEWETSYLSELQSLIEESERASNEAYYSLLNGKSRQAYEKRYEEYAREQEYLYAAVGICSAEPFPVYEGRRLKTVPHNPLFGWEAQFCLCEEAKERAHQMELPWIQCNECEREHLFPENLY
jgi:hypothetical protein